MLVLLNILEKRAIQTFQIINVSVTARENPELIEQLNRIFVDLKKKVLSMGIESNPVHKDLTVNMVVKTRENDPMSDIRKAIEELPGVTHFKLD